MLLILVCLGLRPPTWNLLSAALKTNARNWFVRRAENRGIPWNAMTRVEVDRFDALRAAYDAVRDSSISFPQYYTMPFHGYDDGNLCWSAAFENAASTLSMSSRYWDDLTAHESAHRMRRRMVDALLRYDSELGTSFMDVGCSVGISLNTTVAALKDRGHTFDRLYGLDLSAYFLSIAVVNDDAGVEFLHANAEAIPLCDSVVDCVTVSFMMHELPGDARKNVLSEVHRVLRPNGTIAILDLDPGRLRQYFRSSWRRWAFEATEPHIFDYYHANLPNELTVAGFARVETEENDPLNSVWLARRD